MPEQQECPRCASSGVRQLAASPVAGAWTVMGCGRCGYSWRSTEPRVNSSRAHYPEKFRITEAELAAAAEVPVVPDRD